MTDRSAGRRATGWARTAVLAGGLLAVLSVAVIGCGTTTHVPDPTASSGTALSPTEQLTLPSSTARADETAAATTSVENTTADSAVDALALLATLPVQGRAPQTDYSRGQFGQTWSDDVTVDGGHNGCDTRNDVLRRDITDAKIKPGTLGCVVLSGTLADPYTGTVVPFLRGSATSDDVQIDHLVALSDAWQTGAQQLSAEQRQNLANDPDNLQATLGWLNQQKGDGDAATWLPPNKNYRCTYVSRQIEVKAKYQLWVKPAEKDAMTRVLTSCPTTMTSEPSTPAVGTPPATDQLASSVPGAATTPIATGPATAPFPNCAAARAAGAAPVHVGDPGYSTKLDGDRDGIACE